MIIAGVKITDIVYVPMQEGIEYIVMKDGLLIANEFYFNKEKNNWKGSKNDQGKTC